MKIRLIVNPRAGTGVSPDEVERVVRENVPSVEPCLTRGTGDAARLAAEAYGAGADAVVGAGGDGLVNEIVNGLAPRMALPVGIIPLGTGNDLARSLGIPLDLRRAAAVLRQPAVRRIDVGCVTDTHAGAAGGERWFANVLIAGFGADIELSTSEKRSWKSRAYLRRIVADLPKLRPVRVTLTLDGGERLKLDALAIAVANGRTVGGGVPVAPEADLGDGRFDLIAVRSMSVPKLLSFVPRLVTGTHMNNRHVVARRVSRVTIAGDEGLRINADGEVLDDRPVSVRLVEGALRVLVPEPGRTV